MFLAFQITIPAFAGIHNSQKDAGWIPFPHRGTGQVFNGMERYKITVFKIPALASKGNYGSGKRQRRFGDG
jgi:hypothetical protein